MCESKDTTSVITDGSEYTTRAAKKFIKKIPSLVERNIYPLMAVDGLKPTLTRNPPDKRVDDNNAKSIWNRGYMMLPQVMENFSSDANLVEMVKGHDSMVGSRVRHFEGGDGAPMNAMFKLQRQGLNALRAESLDNEEGDGNSSTCSDGSESTCRSEISIETEKSNSSSDASLDSGSSRESTDTEAAGDVSVKRADSEKRKPKKELTPEEARVLVNRTQLTIGFWNCFQESIYVSLKINRDAWEYLGSIWRRGGRLAFMLRGGNVNEHVYENGSAVVGVLDWWKERYLDSNPDQPNYLDFDAFMDKEASKYPVLAQFRDAVEHFLITKCIHDSMRQGMLSNVDLLLEQLTELCGAAAAKIYLRCD